MAATADKKSAIPSTRRKLLDATVALMLQRGFSATTVEQICAEAGVTKGSFFHYFESKEAIGLAALDQFAAYGMNVYASANPDPSADPLAQFHRLIDFMIQMIRTSDVNVVCLIGMLAQEHAATNEKMRHVCDAHLAAWAAMVSGLLAAAKREHPPKVDFDPDSVAWMLNSLWQGSMLIAKTRQSPEMIAGNLRHGRAYVDSLFG